MSEIPRNNEGTNATNPVVKTENFVSKHFVRLLVCLAVSGGALAIFGPWLLYVAGITGETDANLRLHILYITGGTIAVLGLVETHRKNTVDREKAGVEKENYEKIQAHQANVLEEQQRQFNVTMDQEREKIEADKAKNEQDHIRQVHSERRSRYTIAIEQLSDDKASIRLGGVYTLVGLVDEWLADEKTIPNTEERHKEGQVIINNLCAYIRSPFLLAERAEQLDKPYAKYLQKDFDGDKEKFDADKRSFARDKAALEEERQVRLSIIKEMHEHLHDAEKPGPWSGFDYDFSNAHFFYPIDFVYSYFGVFSNFSGVTFTEDANFFGAEFTGGANFNEATFTKRANFSEAKFTRGAYFSEAKFTRAVFFKATFTKDANFFRTTFVENADFTHTTFTREANFSGATFTQANLTKTTFTVYSNFSGVTFTEDATFFRATFIRYADFSEATFTQVIFTKAVFIENADFSGAIFTKSASFFRTAFQIEPIFVDIRWGRTYKARFSSKANPEDYNFEVSDNGRYKIETKEQEHNGIKFVMPKGAELFDPDEPSEQGNNDGS